MATSLVQRIHKTFENLPIPHLSNDSAQAVCLRLLGRIVGELNTVRSLDIPLADMAMVQQSMDNDLVSLQRFGISWPASMPTHTLQASLFFDPFTGDQAAGAGADDDFW